MNFIYTKLMSWAVGEALANSDRVRVMALALAGIVFTRILAACPQCSVILTPDVVQSLTVALGGAAVTLVAALSHRDVAAPGQTVAGAAVPVVPVVAAPAAAPAAAKVAAFLLVGILGLAALGLPARAQALSLGPVTLSPTAAPLVVSFEPVASLTSFALTSGGELSPNSDVIGGMAALANWGPYHTGFDGVYDRDTVNSVSYLAGGVLVGIRGYGDVTFMWRKTGAMFAYAIPLGAGVTP